MQYELTGILKLKRDEQKVSDSFKKREFVVTDNSSNYPQHVLFQMKQDKCRLLDDYNPGDEVKVGFFISGREWQKDGVVKYFTSLDAWKIERTDKGSSSSQGNQSAQADYATEAALPATEEQDDLPF